MLTVPRVLVTWLTIASVLLGASRLPAQAGVERINVAPGGAAVRGIVFDSLARRPIADAVVQLVAAEDPSRLSRNATTSATGDFVFTDVPAGRFLITFLHPVLDSLGLEAPVRMLSRVDTATVRADLGLPSLPSLRRAICGASAGAGGALVMGIVRDARTHDARGGAHVDAEWNEVSITAAGLRPRRGSRSAVAMSSGRYALCDLPLEGSVYVVGSRGSDSTDRVELVLSGFPLLRRDLLIAPPTDSVSGRRRGGVRVTGVVTTDDGIPVARAQVSLTGGASTTSDARGEWALDSLPAGTRAFEARAVGFLPRRVTVDVIPGGLPARIMLNPMRTALDTVRIRGAATSNFALSGFDDRRSTGIGHFLTAERIMRQRPQFISELLLQVPGLRVEGREVYMRGTYDRQRDDDRCRPTFWMDGMMLGALSLDELDHAIPPTLVAGIEVYREGQVPSQYQNALEACGVLLIWRKSR